MFKSKNKLNIIVLILGIIAVSLVVSLFLFLLYQKITAPRGFLEVDFLDVGQGDAILIQAPEGQNILIDGGPNNTVIRRIGKELPWWDRTIDLMILTHPHEDHINGLNDVLERYKVAQIIYTGVEYNYSGYDDWLDLISEKNISSIVVNESRTINLGQNCELKIVYPEAGTDLRAEEDLNETSIVSKLDCLGGKFLFTGDAGFKVEEELLNNGRDLSADVLKVGHHGSANSTGDDFLEAINSEIAVIQVGADNDFGHPKESLLHRLRRDNLKIYRTDLDGTIHFVVHEGESMQIY
ncbi:MAG: ComEC/Rec2 family competence protein [bacterium]